MKVYALPGDLPDTIEIDISKLKIGMAIRVSDVNNDKLNITNAANSVICSVKMARGVVEDDEDEEEGAEGAEGASEEGAES